MGCANSSIDLDPLPFCRPEMCAFFFDVDGTLLELAPRPQDVVSDPILRSLLQTLLRRAGGALALISGRSLADLDRIFSPFSFAAAGLHGAEIRYPDGDLRAASSHLMDHARPRVARFVAEHPGLLLEDKGATIAVHFRQRPELGASVLAFLNEFTPGDDIAVQEGKLVAELKPALFDKGAAIESLLQRPPFAGRSAIFFGDDLTDEAGFAFVNRAGGLSVRIGVAATPTEARYHLPDAAALREWMTKIVAQRQDDP